MKDQLRQLFTATLEQLCLQRVLQARLTCEGDVLSVGGERIELKPFKKIIGVAIGKAAFQMAEAAAQILKPRIITGVVVSSAPAPRQLPYFLTYTGGHPYPDSQSVHAANVAQALLRDSKPHHLILYFLSGGGSAICEKPISEAISLEDCREFYRLLVTCGANIVEMNVLRKHFSAIKGGRLAVGAHPARQVTMYVSDVPADQPSSVASGPTMPDESSVADCHRLAAKLGLLERLPPAIRRFFDEDRIEETPKPGDAKFSKSSWHCLLDSSAAVEAVFNALQPSGWVVETDLSVDDWPLERAADHLLGRLRSLRAANPGRTVAVLTAGELSWPVTGGGEGGRNQAFALDCAQKIAGENIAVVSAGTDGIDGNSKAAGALADGETLERGRRIGLDAAVFQRRSDSFHYFEALGDAIVTGPSGNNVRDLRLLVAW